MLPANAFEVAFVALKLLVIFLIVDARLGPRTLDRRRADDDFRSPRSLKMLRPGNLG
jgi:hypothetical protein